MIYTSLSLSRARSRSRSLALALSLSQVNPMLKLGALIF